MVINKVVVIGPEATGKSTLCEQLAAYYKTAWCPEYAREYLELNGTSYTYDDLLTIAKGQIESEEKHLRNIANANLDHRSASVHNNALLFIDTDMYVMKVWCEFVFGKCHRYILDTIVERQYDLYLLCDTDLPWVQDELREYPDLKTRQRLYNIYEDLMINQHVSWAVINGTYEERFNKAVRAVEQLLSVPNRHS